VASKKGEKTIGHRSFSISHLSFSRKVSSPWSVISGQLLFGLLVVGSQGWQRRYHRLYAGGGSVFTYLARSLSLRAASPRAGEMW